MGRSVSTSQRLGGDQDAVVISPRRRPYLAAFISAKPNEPQDKPAGFAEQDSRTVVTKRT
jgi:hypothetical protein